MEKIKCIINNIRIRLKLYSCNVKKGQKCPASNRICKRDYCKRITNYKYAKKTPLNFIKHLIKNRQKVRGNKMNETANACESNTHTHTGIR